MLARIVLGTSVLLLSVTAGAAEAGAGMLQRHGRVTAEERDTTELERQGADAGERPEAEEGDADGDAGERAGAEEGGADGDAGERAGAEEGGADGDAGERAEAEEEAASGGGGEDDAGREQPSRPQQDSVEEDAQAGNEAAEAGPKEEPAGDEEQLAQVSRYVPVAAPLPSHPPTPPAPAEPLATVMPQAPAAPSLPDPAGASASIFATAGGEPLALYVPVPAAGPEIPALPPPPAPVTQVSLPIEDPAAAPTSPIPTSPTPDGSVPAPPQQAPAAPIGDPAPAAPQAQPISGAPPAGTLFVPQPAPVVASPAPAATPAPTPGPAAGSMLQATPAPAAIPAAAPAAAPAPRPLDPQVGQQTEPPKPKGPDGRGPIFGANAGYSRVTSGDDINGFGIDLYAGYGIGRGLVPEAKLGLHYFNSSTELLGVSVDVSNWVVPILVGARYQVDLGSPARPWAGSHMGFGYVRTNGKIRGRLDGETLVGDKASGDTSFSIDFGAGVDFDITSAMGLGAGVWYLVNFADGAATDDVQILSIGVDLRYDY